MEEKKTQTVCPYAKKCGGCQYQGVPYSAQLKKKQNQVQGLLKKFGNVKPVIGMKDPYFYRNKVHAVFDRDRKGNIISGIYEAGTHRVVSIEQCLIEYKKKQRTRSSVISEDFYVLLRSKHMMRIPDMDFCAMYWCVVAFLQVR